MNAQKSVSTLIISLGFACSAAAPAWGQVVYRCGSSYGSQPCEGGRALAAQDPRTPEQRAQSDNAALRDAMLADGLQEARRQEEARMAAYRPYAAPAAAATKTPARKGREVFTARTPGEHKKTSAGKKKRAAQAASESR